MQWFNVWLSFGNLLHCLHVTIALNPRPKFALRQLSLPYSGKCLLTSMQISQKRFLLLWRMTFVYLYNLYLYFCVLCIEKERIFRLTLPWGQCALQRAYPQPPAYILCYSSFTQQDRPTNGWALLIKFSVVIQTRCVRNHPSQFFLLINFYYTCLTVYTYIILCVHSMWNINLI